MTAPALSSPGLQCFPHFIPNVVENTAPEKNLKWLWAPAPSTPLPPSLSNAPLKAPEGFIPAQGGTEQNSSTPEVPSGPVCVTCVWPRPRQRLSGLSDGAPITAERHRPACPIADLINFWEGMKVEASRKLCNMYLDAEIFSFSFFLPFTSEQAGTENRVERFLRLLGLSPPPRAGSRRRRRRDRSRAADKQF